MRRIREHSLRKRPTLASEYATSHLLAESHKVFRASFRQLLRLKSLRWTPSTTVIDIGCGPGVLTASIAQLAPSCRVIGIDDSAAMIRWARRSTRLTGGPSFIRGDFLTDYSTLPTADLAISNGALHHFRDQTLFWRAVAAILAPNAYLLVHDLVRPPSRSSLNSIVRKVTTRRHFDGLLLDDYRASLGSAYTPDEVAAALSTAGLHGISVRPLPHDRMRIFGRVFNAPHCPTRH